MAATASYDLAAHPGSSARSNVTCVQQPHAASAQHAGRGASYACARWAPHAHDQITHLAAQQCQPHARHGRIWEPRQQRTRLL